MARQRTLVEILDDHERSLRRMTAALARIGDRNHDHDLSYSPIGHNHDATYSQLGHTHSYLPLSGGTLTGDLAMYSTAFEDGAGTGGSLQLRALTNPANGEPIFEVRSSGQAVRLRVEHSGLVAAGDATGNPAMDQTDMHTWVGDTDTGMFRAGADVIGFRIGGTEYWRFQSDGDLAFRNGDQRIKNNLGNTVLWFVNSDQSTIFGTNTVGHARIFPGTTGQYSFHGDGHTYFGRNADNVLEVVTGGTQAMQWGTAVLSTAIRDATTGAAANGFVNSTSGVLGRSTSARKYKTRITYNVDYLADIELRPAKFYRKDDKRWFYGMIADDLAEQDPLLGDYDEEGNVENYDDREVLAILAAKVNRLEKALKNGL